MELEQDVIEESSTLEEQDVNTELEESSTQEEPEQETPPQGQVDEELDERGVPWKNKAMELERKLRENVDNLPNIIKQTLAEANKEKETKPQYTVAQLRQFSIENQDNPQYVAWAEEQIDAIKEQKLEAKLQEIRKKEREELQAQQTRQQVEMEVVSNPRYSEAFVVDSAGNKVWNQGSKLTNLAAQYMQDARIANEPDALAIAMKLAYADYIDLKQGTTQQELTGLKRQAAKLKQATLVEGSGVDAPTSKATNYSSAIDRLAKTGSKTDAYNAVREILKSQGKIGN